MKIAVKYYMQIERTLAKNARIDSIGMQFHMFYNREDEKKETELFYDPLHLYRVWNRYFDFEKPMHLTEITIPAYSTSEEDEYIQAEIIKICIQYGLDIRVLSRLCIGILLTDMLLLLRRGI